MTEPVKTPIPAEGTPGPRYKRSVKNFVLDRTFQFKYTGMIVLASGLIFGATEYAIYDKVRENSELAGLTDDPAMAAQLQQELEAEDRKVLLKLVGLWLALVSSLTVVGILATHRIVGPVYVVDRYIQRIKNGEPVHPRPLRRGDEFQSLYNHVNEMATTLRQERMHEAEALEIMVQRISVRLESLEKLSGEAAEIANRLREELATARRLARDKRAWLNEPES